jgi:hypothetical protein
MRMRVLLSNFLDAGPCSEMLACPAKDPDASPNYDVLATHLQPYAACLSGLTIDIARNQTTELDFRSLSFLSHLEMDVCSSIAGQHLPCPQTYSLAGFLRIQLRHCSLAGSASCSSHDVSSHNQHDIIA